MSAPTPVRLRLLPREHYVGVGRDDPIRFYSLPLIGRLYRRRVELCLSECSGGERVLEIGFGSGVTFPHLAERYEEVHGLDLTADVERVEEAWRSRGIRTVLKNGDVRAMPFRDGTCDTVLLISILEHLRPTELEAALLEVRRVLRPGGQMVYGVPVERRLMVQGFRLLGYDIREHHFSTEHDVRKAAGRVFRQVRLVPLEIPLLGSLYEVGHWVRVEE